MKNVYILLNWFLLSITLCLVLGALHLKQELEFYEDLYEHCTTERLR